MTFNTLMQIEEAFKTDIAVKKKFLYKMRGRLFHAKEDDKIKYYEELVTKANMSIARSEKALEEFRQYVWR